MLVSPALSYGTSSVNAMYPASTKRLDQPVKTSQVAASKPYEVILTSEAKAKSMRLEGYPISLIAVKLGLDTKTINSFLGITVAANNAATKTTYTPPKSTYSAPKSTYTAPKASYTEPQALTQNRAFLAEDLTQLPTLQYAASKIIDSATTGITS